MVHAGSRTGFQEHLNWYFPGHSSSVLIGHPDVLSNDLTRNWYRWLVESSY